MKVAKATNGMSKEKKKRPYIVVFYSGRKLCKSTSSGKAERLCPMQNEGS